MKTSPKPTARNNSKSKRKPLEHSFLHGTFPSNPPPGASEKPVKKEAKICGDIKCYSVSIAVKDTRTCRWRLLFITGCPGSKYHREIILIPTLLGQLLRYILGKLLNLKLTHSY